MQDEEIDLFLTLKTLWHGKWVISAFILTALLIGTGYVFSKDAKYESKLNYFFEATPPFYNNEQISADFKTNFYSKKVFEDWKKNVGKTSLVFEDFSITEDVDGFVMTKSKDKQLALVIFKKKRQSFVLIKTNQLSILQDFFKYSNYINDILKVDYINRSKKEINIIKSRFKSITPGDKETFTTVFALEQFIFSVAAGKNILLFQHPTKPNKLSPRSSLILTLSFLLGGLIGALFVIILNAIRKRKE